MSKQIKSKDSWHNEFRPGPLSCQKESAAAEQQERECGVCFKFPQDKQSRRRRRPRYSRAFALFAPPIKSGLFPLLGGWHQDGEKMVLRAGL